METGENSQSKRNEEEGGEEIHDMRVTHVHFSADAAHRFPSDFLLMEIV